MRTYLLCLLVGLGAAVACTAQDSAPTDGFTFEHGLDLRVNGIPWLRTVVTPFDQVRAELTYKVYTHLYDFEGVQPITKGAGGKYTHHRGLFMGWNHTHVSGRRVDTWHMRAGREGPLANTHTHQQLVEWVELRADQNQATQTALIHWAVDGEAPFIEERRTIAARSGLNGIRVIDFVSTLSTLAGPIQLRGDSHHAGMQIRMANEVVDNEDATEFILPDGAADLGKDTVEGAWWACGTMPIGGKRYWILHMTAPDLVTGQPHYSLRTYGRFGAFFEPDLIPDTPLRLAFRIILSETPLDQTQCDALYQQYSDEVKGNE